MTRAYIVIIALGGSYFGMAEHFRISAQSHEWNAEIHIVSDNEGADTVIPSGSYHDAILEMVDFVKYVPSAHAGAVVLMDADMEAVGVEPDWVEGRICAVRKHDGRVHTPGELTPKSGTMVDGMIIVCQDRDAAKELCAQWVKQKAKPDDHGQCVELLSLWRVARTLEITPLSGDRHEPYKGKLKHFHTLGRA